MSTFLWIFCATVYLMALVVLGMTTLRKGHTWLFVIGIFLPFLWIVGALIGPSPRAAGTASPRGLGPRHRSALTQRGRAVRASAMPPRRLDRPHGLVCGRSSPDYGLDDL